MSKLDMVVRQSNNFIESAFTQEYSEQELKTMEFIISQTTRADIELANNDQIKRIELSAQYFAKMINAHCDQIYREASKLSDALMNKKINFKYTDENGKLAFIKETFLTSMCYQSGVIKIGVNPFVLPYFLEIKERFTEFNLRYLIAIGSSYGIKLYKLLKQYQSIGNRELTIEEMRNQFGLDINKYKLYSGFKRDVIEIAKKHINLHTDIQINYEEIKHGRKVQKIKFYIKTKIPQFKQAQIAFLDWAINSDFNNLRNILKDADSIKKDPFHFTMVKESLEWFLTNKVFNYDPNSCEPLQYYGTDTLFGQ